MIDPSQMLQRFDVAICLSSGSANLVGKTAQLREEWTGSVGAFCGIIRPRDNIDPLFLGLWFKGPQFRSWRDAQARGANIQNLRLSELASLEFSLPPLPHQRRIVAALDAQLAAAARAHAAVASRQFDAAQFIQRWIDDHFSSLSAGCVVRPLEEEGTIQAGVTLGKDYYPQPTVNVPYLRVANVKDGRLELTDVKSLDVPQKTVETLALRFGDLLLTEGGDPDKVGRGTLWQEELPVCIHQNHIFRVRFDPARFDPVYLSLQFRSAYAKAYFLAHSKKTTGIASINQQVLRAYPLICHPLSEQRAIVAAYQVLEMQSSKLLKALHEQLSALDLLPARLLARAFTDPHGQETQEAQLAVVR
ncbi:MAG: restriction endonuclease subunit S [Opitutae bacterium]|nr:restriction endonuclease subunit S [Opitutae bacterium]